MELFVLYILSYRLGLWTPQKTEMVIPMLYNSPLRFPQNPSNLMSWLRDAFINLKKKRKKNNNQSDFKISRWFGLLSLFNCFFQILMIVKFYDQTKNPYVIGERIGKRTNWNIHEQNLRKENKLEHSWTKSDSDVLESWYMFWQTYIYSLPSSHIENFPSENILKYKREGNKDKFNFTIANFPQKYRNI